jgi:gamma-butyrobetaine dioxygenase
MQRRQLPNYNKSTPTSEVTPQTVPAKYAHQTYLQWQARAIDALKMERQLFNSEGKPVIFPILLRDACRCSQCVDPSTRQRNFSFFNIPPNIRAIQEATSPNGDFNIRWENDIPGFSDHISTFSLDELVNVLGGKTPAAVSISDMRTGWDTKSIAENLVQMPYEEYMSNDASLFHAIEALRRYGLAFVTKVPSSPESVGKLVERIGPLRNSFYGSTWDVESKPNADNVAYTHKDLGFHMDLLYMSQVPDFQFLHCIRNTCSGGESRFVDTYQARKIMEAEHPEQCEALQDRKVVYEYQNFGQYYTKRRPVFNRVDGVFWSPPFVGRLADKTQTLKKFLLACETFANILERPNLVYETKMAEDTCVIFQNTRVAHARNAFGVNNGRRWLRGAYLDLQPFLSTRFRLARQLSSDTTSTPSQEQM